MSLSYKLIKPLLQTGTSALSRWFSYIGLGIGVLLLLCSIQLFVDIEQLFGKNVIRKNGFDFVSVTRKITNDNAGQMDKTLFHDAELKDLRAQPFAGGAEPLISTQFRVSLSGGALLNFRTDLFLEAIDNEYLDTIPPVFSWKEGQENVPLIVSSDFFEVYNIFAPSRNLPQLSKETAIGLPILILCEGGGKEATFRGNVVAFSDRITSVLAPKSFVDWGNATFAPGKPTASNRVYVKTKDANDPQLLQYLDQKDYSVNREKTRFGRAKQTLNGIFSGLGVYGLMVVILALMLFSFYLQLVIARSRDSLQLLLLLGYSPVWLSKNVSRQFIPVYILIVLFAVALVQIMQWAFHHFVMYDRPELDTMIHWSVLATGLLLIGAAVITNYRLVKGLLYKLYQSS